MAKTKYPRNPAKVKAPPGAGSYKLKNGEYQRLDKPQDRPKAISDRKAEEKAKAGAKEKAKSGGDAKAGQTGGNADSENNVRPLRDKGKKE